MFHCIINTKHEDSLYFLASSPIRVYVSGMGGCVQRCEPQINSGAKVVSLPQTLKVIYVPNRSSKQFLLEYVLVQCRSYVLGFKFRVLWRGQLVPLTNISSKPRFWCFICLTVSNGWPSLVNSVVCLAHLFAVNCIFPTVI